MSDSHDHEKFHGKQSHEDKGENVPTELKQFFGFKPQSQKTRGVIVPALKAEEKNTEGKTIIKSENEEPPTSKVEDAPDEEKQKQDWAEGEEQKQEEEEEKKEEEEDEDPDEATQKQDEEEEEKEEGVIKSEGSASNLDKKSSTKEEGENDEPLDKCKKPLKVFNCLPLHIGCLVIAVCCLLACVFNVIVGIIYAAKGTYCEEIEDHCTNVMIVAVGEIMLNIVGIIFCIMYILAVLRGNTTLMLVFFGWSVFNIVLTVAVIIGVVIVTSSYINTMIIVFLVIMIVLTLFHCYILYFIWNYRAVILHNIECDKKNKTKTITDV